MPRAKVLRSGSVIRITFNRPVNPYLPASESVTDTVSSGLDACDKVDEVGEFGTDVPSPEVFKARFDSCDNDGGIDDITDDEDEVPIFIFFASDVGIKPDAGAEDMAAEDSFPIGSDERIDGPESDRDDAGSDERFDMDEPGADASDRDEMADIDDGVATDRNADVSVDEEDPDPDDFCWPG